MNDNQNTIYTLYIYILKKIKIKIKIKIRTIKKPGSGFMCRQRFQNTLPELPFNPKLVEFPFPRDRLYSYKTSQLIENTPYKVLPPDNELGTSLNLIDMKVFEEGPDNKNSKYIFKWYINIYINKFYSIIIIK